jgi:hypothetical protein
LLYNYINYNPINIKAKILAAAQMHAEAAPKGVAHPAGECDRSGEGEVGGEFGEGEHEG